MGQPRRRTDARQPALGAVHAHSVTPPLLPKRRLRRPPPDRRVRHHGALQEAMTLRLSVTLAVVLGVTALLVAPTLSATAADAPRGGTLRMSRFSDVDFVDPALAYTNWSWPIGYATCAKLFNYPDAAGAAGTRLVPELVERYTISNDGRIYTFGLKRTFRFHTGAQVTAQSFADAFNRVAQPKLASP